ncbi:ATP synthase F1 subunit delta [Candidatus Galacturonibacter soehngenii]|uniref:ATP synthase subunit delta n=1 Tax=Candidatus Galacturonatibacter soehngenii TaxID=2307010 RepID=A0A7V7QLX3_9FIRM|nr:ATP synthase F1 subunit delta [Candidatus Galacturonibacter soehngenii]KAB1438586.1 ATP synthase F1 subunit delta [Candidatus Galacturonibacter soehngenii]MBA4685617.1 ATP synthase F1 subunit delta [Candidatus Galacturonibacter soehngenii]
MAKLVAKTYGDALFELAVEQQTVYALEEEVQGVLLLLQENVELNKLMNHPKITKEEKNEIIEEIFKGRISDELTGFLHIIVTKDRYNEIANIFEYFIQRVREFKNIGLAYVSSAVELKEEQKAELIRKLLQITKFEQIDVIYTVDQTLIGGMIIRIGDRVIDSSIKTKLHEMSKNLSKLQIN